MRASALSLMRLALATDALAQAVIDDARARLVVHDDRLRAAQPATAIATRCLHCRTPLLFGHSGQPLNGATLEHVVPRSWFGRGAARELTAGLDGPDDARNLALACAACNHAKGRGPDARGPGDARAREVVIAAQSRRMARWREDPAAPQTMAMAVNEPREARSLRHPGSARRSPSAAARRRRPARAR